jgi:putative nucleotidyltransferase with HDIG domain
MSIPEHTDKEFSGMDSKDKVANLHLVDLPSLPALLMEALQYTDPDGNQSLTHLVDKISQDPPMVVRILRIANSSFYGMSREINSLQQAIVLLGLNRVRGMLLGVCFSKMLPVQHKDFDYPLFLHHSMAVADCTRQLASYTGIGQDIAFTAGLLHDIGRLVMVLLFPDDFSRVIKEPRPHRVETERRIMGFDHMEIGGKAARYWNLPVAIQEVIEQHENPPTQESAISLGLLVYTAGLLITEAEQGDDSGLERQEAITYMLDRLAIPIDQATHWVNTSQQFADQIVAIL